jgi:hypothetical protein
MLTAVEPGQVRIEIDSCQPEATPGRWLVTWLVRNEGTEPLRLEEGWVPHGRFRGEGHVALEAQIPPGDSTTVSLHVASAEPAGTVVENAFLILRARRGDQSWRLFTRMRVEFEGDGTARPMVETVTAQSVQSD